MSYELTPEGLIFFPKPRKEDEEPEPIWLCAPIEVVSLTQDADDRWGHMLRWHDRDGNQVTWNMPDRLLADAPELWKELLSRGLAISTDSKARNALLVWLNDAKPSGRTRVVDAVGWYTGDGFRVFVTPDDVYGNKSTTEITYREPDGVNAYETRGTLDQWIEKIGTRCAGNSRLVVAVCAAFAAPLLRLSGEEGGGMNFKGDSRTGKSTTGIVGGSVCGPQEHMVRPWRGTDNGLEAVFEQHNDCLIVLDELSQVEPHVAGKIAYMIANGEGKTRMGRDTELRKSKRWRVLFISTGEISLSDKMGENGQTPRAGQEVRMLDIPADAGAGMGVFENLHGAGSPGEFAEQLKMATEEFHGTPFRAFIESIAAVYADDPDGFRIDIRETRDHFLAQHLPAGSSGQVRTACGRFGIIAVAGEIATGLGLTGWGDGEATRAAARCFQDWLDQRDTIGDHDIERAIERVLALIEQYGNEHHFVDCNSELFDTARKRYGYRKMPAKNTDGNPVYQYLVLPSVWSELFCKGYDYKAVAREMIRRGLLEKPGRDNELSKVVNCGRYGRIRVYALKPGLGTENEPDTRTPAQKRKDWNAWMLSENPGPFPNGHAPQTDDEAMGGYGVTEPVTGLN